jgi:hypothetical protein
VREELAEGRFVDEEPAGGQNALDLAQRVGGAGDVVARAEVDNDVKRVIIEGERADIADQQLGGARTRGEMDAGPGDEASVNIDADQPRGLAHPGEDGQGDAAAAADFENTAPMR